MKYTLQFVAKEALYHFFIAIKTTVFHIISILRRYLASELACELAPRLRLLARLLFVDGGWVFL